MLFLTVLLLALPFFTLSCFAQITSIATVYDGSRLYLTTNSPRSSNPEPAQGRIFVMDADGLRLFRERQKQPGPDSLFDTYSLSSVDLSSDGGVLSYAGRSDCSGFNLCATEIRDRSTVETFAGKPPFRVPGFVRLSPTGRFGYVDFRGVGVGGSNHVVDLARGILTPALVDQRARNVAGRFLANDGSLVGASRGALMVQRPGGVVEVVYDNPQEQILEATISADAQRIFFISVWTSPAPQVQRLRLFDRQTQESTTLVEGTCDASDPVLSDDAELILFRCAAARDRPQAWVLRRDGSGVRKLTDDLYGVQKAILSGDGKVVFAQTGADGVVRIDLTSGEQTTSIPNTLTLKSNATAVPGSVYTLEGTLLSRVKAIRGVPDAPILARSETMITFQVPWETNTLALGEQFNLELDSASDYPFANPHPRFPLPIRSYFPGFYDIPAISQNFEHFVSADQPAAPGDVVHFFARGLGPVDIPVPTGTLTPSNGPLSRATLPFTCSSFNREVPVLFAGLAPGMIGVYQVTIRIPTSAVGSVKRPDLFQVVCSQIDAPEIPFRQNP